MSFEVVFRDNLLVSIGMPVRNGGVLLRKALASVVAQDYSNLEIIVSGNASTDETADIVREFQANDARIRYMRHERMLPAFSKSCGLIVSTPSAEVFLNSVIAEGVTRGEVTFRTDKASERDFVSVQDVCDMIVVIALRGERRLYNLASGKNVSNAMIARLLKKRGIKTAFVSGAPKVTYPILDVGAIRQEFGFEPKSFRDVLERYGYGKSRNGRAIVMQIVRLWQVHLRGSVD